MPVDHIRYDILAQEALRGMVRNVLTDAAKNKGLPGEHHFFITFDTTAEGVRLSDRLRAQYPEEMTIVLQHQFWDLKVTDDAFEVGLSFGGVPERLLVPFDAIKGFVDPSVQFALQFETLAEAPDEDADEAETPNAGQAAAAASAGAARAGSRPAPAFRRARCRRADRRRRAAQPQTSPATRAAPRSCGSTASARSDGQSARPTTNARAARPAPGPRPTPSARSRCRPTATGARRPSARSRISASAPSACRCR